MKVINKKKQPMTENLTIRLRKDTMMKIKTIAEDNIISKMLLVNFIIEKALSDPKFEIDLQ